MLLSHDEQLVLWIEAMKVLKGKREEKRKMKGALKIHLKHIVRRRGMETEIVQKYIEARQQDSDWETSDFSEHESSSESEYVYLIEQYMYLYSIVYSSRSQSFYPRGTLKKIYWGGSRCHCSLLWGSSNKRWRNPG